MANFIIRRFIQGFVVLVLATFVVYSLLIITPGGPADQVAARNEGKSTALPAQVVKALMAKYKLDLPYPVNYLAWLFDPRETTELDQNNKSIPKGIDITIGSFHIQGSGLLTGDLGRSLNVAAGRPVVEQIGARLGNTLLLTSSSLFLSILIAFPIGVISAIRQYSKLDYTVTAFSFVGLSMPTFWLGLMLIIFLGVLPKLWHQQNHWDWLPYFPTGGAYKDASDGSNFIDRIYHLVLPVTVLSFVNVASYSRYVRSSMLEVLRQDYVRTAWAKGLTQRVVILKHALRNALIPVITVVTLSLPFLLSGAIVTETVFTYPGMGKLFADSVFQLDVPLVMGFLLISTASIIISNILADILYAFTDPRIRYS